MGKKEWAVLFLQYSTQLKVWNKIKRVSENQLKIWGNIKCEILFEYLLWNEYVCFPQIHGLKPKLSMMVFVGFLRSNLVLYMEDTWRELLPW